MGGSGAPSDSLRHTSDFSLLTRFASFMLLFSFLCQSARLRRRAWRSSAPPLLRSVTVLDFLPLRRSAASRPRREHAGVTESQIKVAPQWVSAQLCWVGGGGGEVWGGPVVTGPSCLGAFLPLCDSPLKCRPLNAAVSAVARSIQCFLLCDVERKRCSGDSGPWCRSMVCEN